MTEQLYKDIYDEHLAKGAIINDRHTGHKEDYLLLHILLRKYKPKSFMEIGTNSGFGTLIIINALGDGNPKSNTIPVYSIDLPPEEAWKSQQHPISEGKISVGYECDLPYTQILADSRRFDYSEYPCEGYFVDSEHTYENVMVETRGILKQNPKIIIYHDADEQVVYEAIRHAFYRNTEYTLFRVTDTRIAYALKKDI